jgi:hypothetical protein
MMILWAASLCKIRSCVATAEVILCLFGFKNLGVRNQLLLNLLLYLRESIRSGTERFPSLRNIWLEKNTPIHPRTWCLVQTW